MPKQAWINTLIQDHTFPDEEKARLQLSQCWDKSYTLELTQQAITGEEPPCEGMNKQMTGKWLGGATSVLLLYCLAGYTNLPIIFLCMLSGAFAGEELHKALISDTDIERSVWITHLKRELEQAGTDQLREAILSNHLIFLQKNIRLKYKKDAMEYIGHGLSAVTVIAPLQNQSLSNLEAANQVAHVFPLSLLGAAFSSGIAHYLFRPVKPLEANRNNESENTHRTRPHRML